ncbi:putative Xaa-Pro aminopeptidase P [Grifola frondosa]|uniref:Putative Xaa-Pro aminopeptidase P n=1 Tax=Grifola frondosa TaxID=5627 RepID=A0A1C7M0W3_GRIFR|nr:putative Xaa-Pro aminopeptidase P [Grifola frondosa]
MSLSRRVLFDASDACDKPLCTMPYMRMQTLVTLRPAHWLALSCRLVLPQSDVVSAHHGKSALYGRDAADQLVPVVPPYLTRIAADLQVGRWRLPDGEVVQRELLGCARTRRALCNITTLRHPWLHLPRPAAPPLCLPFFGGKKPRRRLTFSEKSTTASFDSDERSSIDRLERSGSYSPTATLTSRAEKLTFSSETEEFDVSSYHNEARENNDGSKKWGYGWGIGKREKEKEREKAMMENSPHSSKNTNLPVYTSPRLSHNSGHSHDSGRSYDSANSRSSHSQRSHPSRRSAEYLNPLPPADPSRSNTFKSNTTKASGKSGKSAVALKRPALYPSESSSTLVGSAYERKRNDVDHIPERIDSGPRLESLRALMEKDSLDYYIIPSEDAHGSEYIAINDKRREWISGFTGSAGQAIISKTSAYLITDSRYWIQARHQLDNNWVLVEGGAVGGPKDWVDWLLDRAKDSKIGIDARLISYEKASALNNKLRDRDSKLFYPPQNLVDLIWREKPPRSREPIFVQPLEFAGMEAGRKLATLCVIGSNSSAPLPTLLSSLSSIAYILNLRGDDIPFNPVFHSYLFIGLEQAILFIEPAKVGLEIHEYLQSIGVSVRDYNDLWTFLRRKEWGEGNVIISPQTSYAICLMLTSFRYTVLPSYVDDMKAVKNNVELEGLRRAYLRDGAAYVRWLAWLEEKMTEGYDITEYEAAWRLTEYRRMNKHYMGLAYENISASGPNAALPHYVPRKSDETMIDRDTPYLNDSGGQYRDGTCDTTRTVHFGRPIPEQCEAFTRVLQGHIAIDTAVFPEGTNGAQLDVLARKALWKDGLNYMHGTGHGFGSFLNVHEGPQSFSSDVPFVPGHVLTNEPGFYNEGKWGMRIESALAVKRVQTKGQFNGDIWLGFERLTCVPIQTKMVKEVMLSKEERQWLKVRARQGIRTLAMLIKFLFICRTTIESVSGSLSRFSKMTNVRSSGCAEKLSGGIGIAGAGPGGISIDWD